jgi:hypothetical protein
MFDDSDHGLQAFVDSSLGPDAISAIIADEARQAIADAEAVNAAALGRAVAYTTTVDGRSSSDFESVKPDGVIVATFDVTPTSMLEWIEQQLIAHSPVKTGHYQRSHRIFVDGVMTTLDAIAQGVKEIVFAPIANYAPEIEPQDGGRGESRQAPDGVYQAVAELARQQFGELADIAFTWLAVPDIEQPAHSPPPATEPAIVVQFGGA